MKIYLIRHPETDWNRQRRYQGRTGRPLTGHGAATIPALVEYLRDRTPGTVVSSPAAHARAAAEAIAEATGSGNDLLVDDGWCEIDHGSWEGLRHDEVTARFGVEAEDRFNEPLHYQGHRGETLREADLRVACSWAALVEGGGDKVVVSHATPIRLVLCRCLGIPAARQWSFRIDNSSITGIDVTGETTTIDFVNHWPET